MPTKHPKRPRDPNQLAKLIVDLATRGEDGGPPGTYDAGPGVCSLRGQARGGRQG